MLIRITAPHFVVGIDLKHNISAPIVKYMKSWDLSKIRDYCAKKNWKIELLPLDKTTKDD